ncbi:MAG TPA: helix-turn-helix transcriptional regulator [Ktedonobacteraceae bacterium]|nr:helix-turn-helix transcriptional regulator [Ktedonobacteraceae bacterium]
MKDKMYLQNHRLKRTRELRGWTQQEVANHIDLPDARTLRRWENGESFPSLRYRAKLCEIFQQSPENLGLILERQPREKPEPAFAVTPQERESRTLQTTPLFPPMIHLPRIQKDLESEQPHHLGVALVIVTMVGALSLVLPFALKRVLRQTRDV